MIPFGICSSEVEKAPQVLEPLRDLYCGDGDEAAFECHVTGDPPPTIVWTKDGKVSTSETWRGTGYKESLNVRSRELLPLSSKEVNHSLSAWVR